MSAVSPDGALANERRVAVPGTHNFRDIGGYLTSDGLKQTCWHRLYRSDNLAGVAADPAACVFLRDHLHVTCSVDLRTAQERNQQPYTIAGVTTYRIPMVRDADLLQTIQAIPELTEGIVEGLLCDVYERLVLNSKDELDRFFKLLVARGRSPRREEAVVMHCKAGKDRTGVCSALLLLTLGVPLDTVYEDYLLTNRFYAVPPLQAVKQVIKSRVDVGAVSALFEARRSYLERAVQSIEREYHSVEAYMRTALNLSSDDLAVLKEVYLVDVQ